MKPFSLMIVFVAMTTTASCDESLMEELDASTPEACVPYVSSDGFSDAGGCTSDGVLSDEQYREAHEVSGTSRRSEGNSGDDEENTLTQEQYADLVKAVSNADETHFADAVGRLSEMTAAIDSPYEPRSGSSPWWEESGTSNNIYFSNGNVSVGAAVSATSRLQLSGKESSKPSSGMPKGVLRLESSNNQYMFLDGNEIDSYAKKSPWGATTLHLNKNSKSDITLVRNGGRVGIGTNADEAATLAAKGSTINSSGENGSLRINDNASNTANYLLLDGNEIDGANGLHLNAKFNKPVYIAANNSKNSDGSYKSSNYVYMVRNDGRVGIGNLSANQITHKLTVDGSIKAEALVIDTVGGADFVFEDCYDLMSLDEVAAFVEENEHLPGVAPAKEMQQNGLEMGAFQIKLLQKIEELTLYTIEQEKRIKTLEQGCVTR